jgi:hypothetical protein
MHRRDGPGADPNDGAGCVLVRQIVQPLVAWYAGSVALVTLMERAQPRAEGNGDGPAR